MAGDMKLAAFNFVILQKLVDKLRENAITSFKEELPIRRCRHNDDIAAAFRFRLPGSVDFVLHHVDSLAAAHESKHAGICAGSIVLRRKNYAVLYFHSGNHRAFVEYFGG